MRRIECIIMDWAGTAVDYGCFAPVAAFINAFKEIGITVSTEQARRPMGMAKIDHIRELFAMEGIKDAFEELNQRSWNEEDVVTMNRTFERYLFASLANYTTPIPGVIQTLDILKEQGIKIGSTTGYTQAMMDIVCPNAAAQGYRPDHCVTPDHLPAGRPYPYMIYQNMIDLSIPSVDYVVKYGDTIADIKEGLSAKVWTIGVVLGSNELGLTQEEVNEMDATLLHRKKAEVRQQMLLAGAHYVVDSIEELPAVIELINHKLNTLN